MSVVSRQYRRDSRMGQASPPSRRRVPRETTLGEIHTSTSSVCGRTLIASLYQATESTCV